MNTGIFVSIKNTCLEMKTIIYYGSTTGTCEALAGRIADALGGADVRNVTELDARATEYDLIVLGTSTWGIGDMQDDWFDGVNKLKGLNLSGKKIAVFGVGDADSYPDSFCGGMKGLYDAALQAGADVLPGVDAGEYGAVSSDAIVNGAFVGLALDETNAPDKTESRISSWVASLKQ